MKPLRKSLAAFAAVSVMALAAFAGDPSGTWKWTQSFGGGGGGGGGGGQPRESTLVLALKDGKLTGDVTMMMRDEPMKTAITDASFKDDVVTFSVERTFREQKRVTKYTGKLEGDTITGTSEGTGRDGEVRKNEWKATRAK